MNGSSRIPGLVCGFVFGLLLAGSAAAQTGYVTVGGASGQSWREVALKWIALDDTTASGCLQPKELMPEENVVAGGEGDLESIYGFQWFRGQKGMEAIGKEMGLNPRIWVSNGAEPEIEIIDGDPSTFKPLTQLVTNEQYAEYQTATYSGFEFGIFKLHNGMYTLDFGIETPLERIRFYPPQFGVDKRGVPYRDTAPRGYQVSIARYPEDFLLLTTETAPWHVLDKLVGRTVSNTSSIVDVEFDLQFVRFARVDLGVMSQYFSLAEIEAYGRGVPPSALLVSQALDMGAPANYGAIYFGFKVLRRTQAGELVEDPEAPASLVLETRTGSDDTPLAYHVVDELGRDVEVSQTQYERADPPRRDRSGLRLPGMQGPVTEDSENWTSWSSPYATSGENIRSADGRRYLQFRMTLQTRDPLAFVRVDSVTFQRSPLLVSRAFGELSLVGEPERTILELEAGKQHMFAYDVRASFDAPEQQGFDAIHLDLPPGSAFVDLAAGDPPEAISPDSVRRLGDDLSVYFPSHRITAENNRPVRLLFSAPVLSASACFTGEVIDTESEYLPQSIDAGDANEDVATNSLQVYATEARLSALSNVTVSPRVITPNGDGANDRAVVDFTVMGIDSGEVTIDILELSGRRITQVYAGLHGQGHDAVQWDGTGTDDATVPPGVYLCRVSVETESGETRTIRPIAVAY